MNLKTGSNGCYIDDHLRNVREWHRVMRIPQEAAVAWVRVAMLRNDVNPYGDANLRVLVDYGRWLNKLWVCVGYDDHDDSYTVIYNHDGTYWLYSLRDKEQ